MPDILLFGATGYTGKLTAHALARRGADFAIAGRNRAKLDALASGTGDPDVRIAASETSTRCPRARGREGSDHVRRSVRRAGRHRGRGRAPNRHALRRLDRRGGFHREARSRALGARAQQGIAMAPALGFDEVPADVAASLATEGMERPDLTLTYAVPFDSDRRTLQERARDHLETGALDRGRQEGRGQDRSVHALVSHASAARPEESDVAAARRELPGPAPPRPELVPHLRDDRESAGSRREDPARSWHRWFRGGPIQKAFEISSTRR